MFTWQPAVQDSSWEALHNLTSTRNTAVGDCIDYGTLSADTVVDLLAPYAARWNLPAIDGNSLLDLLLWSYREPVGA